MTEMDALHGVMAIAIVILASALSIVWIRGQKGSSSAGGGRFKRLTDSLPWPVWLRGPDGKVVEANRAYWELAGVPNAQDGVTEGKAKELLSVADPFFPKSDTSPLAELAVRSGVAQSESVVLAPAGKRLVFDVTEAPVAENSSLQDAPATIGFARDLTDLEAAQGELARQVAAQEQMLEGMDTGIAIYGPDKRLRWFNEAYCKVWNIEEDVLLDQPTWGTVLERLRERRVLPETADFRAFKRRLEALFTDLLEPLEEYLYLPDERTFKRVISPHPLGGLVMSFEDVTDRIALERSHNTLTAVQRMTLDSLQEGVCVFGSDGRVKLFNEVYAKLLGPDSSWLEDGPHVTELVDRAKERFSGVTDWESFRSQVVDAVAEPKPRNGQMTLSEGQVIEYRYVPLPDGQCLILYLDVTDSTRVAQALNERNEAFDRADLLKVRFIASVSHELRSPLNAIMGFAEALDAGIAGPLPDRGLGYVSNILAASQDLNRLIGEILDLAALQAGFLEMAQEPIDLGRILGAACAEVGAVRANLDVDVEYEATSEVAVSSGIENTIIGDEQRLRHALLALLEMFLSALDTKSGIRVSLSIADDAQPVIKIAPKEGRPSVETLMSFVDPREVGASLRGRGSEVGLTLARHVLEQHGATIEVLPNRRVPVHIECRFSSQDIDT